MKKSVISTEFGGIMLGSFISLILLSLLLAAAKKFRSVPLWILTIVVFACIAVTGTFAFLKTFGVTHAFNAIVGAVVAVWAFRQSGFARYFRPRK